MKVTEKDLIGEIKGFPLEVVQKMCEEQVKQGNDFDPTVFQGNKEATEGVGGFDWDDTVEGFEYWDHIIEGKSFGEFYESIFGIVEVINKSKNELPKYETEGSAGMDIRASLKGVREVTLESLDRVLVPTGLFLEVPVGYEVQVRPRSGLALKNGITVLNAPGTIDSDYRGEVGVILVNLSKEPFTIKDGDRVAQIVFAKVEQANLIESEELSETDRGQGGFGSTGTK